MNYILGLLKTCENMILFFVVMERFSKMTHFIPYSRSISHMAKLFFKEIVKLHDLSTTIVSERDVKFVSYF